MATDFFIIVIVIIIIIIVQVLMEKVNIITRLHFLTPKKCFVRRYFFSKHCIMQVWFLERLSNKGYAWTCMYVA